MTPRTTINSPSVTNNSIDLPSDAQLSDGESGDEPRPTHTSEIGTLKKLPNHNTAWLGSSSGVYFVNTVRQAFSAAFAANKDDVAVPASEDILTGDDVDGQSYNGPVSEKQDAEDHVYRHLEAALGRPPTDRKVAMELVTSFFRCWHPLFPFLHGPQFLKDIDEIYAALRYSHLANGKVKADGVKPCSTSQQSFSIRRKFITFQIVINIAGLDRPDIQLPLESRIKSSCDVTQIAGAIAVRHDMDTIQACLAAELYLVATICLRQASTVAGIILKLIYHAGLHRCPLRYAQLSLEDCEIRKRIFWSAYALDRYLSLSLGDPNTVQDSDIDVCLSGKELHKAVARELVLHPSDEIKLHLPTDASGQVDNDSPSEDPRVFNMNNGPHAREKQLREAAMTAYVHYGRLTGRIIEIFHKSIHARFPEAGAILYLNSDIESWWNGLPASLTGEEAESMDDTESLHHRQLAPFFTILSQQLLLLLNRPRLSLDQATAEFQMGLASCIKASRSSLIALKKHKENGQSMLLPGLLSATWMAGLILAFACQLGKYPKSRACSDISACLRLLESMGSRKWFTVKNCHRVLSLLLENINARKASTSGFLSVNNRNESASSVASMSTTMASGTTSSARKRPYNLDEDAASGPSPKRDGSTATVSEASPSSVSDFRLPLHPASGLSNSSKHLVRENSDSTLLAKSRNTSVLDGSRRLSPPDLTTAAESQNSDGGNGGSTFLRDSSSPSSHFSYANSAMSNNNKNLGDQSLLNNPSSSSTASSANTSSSRYHSMNSMNLSSQPLTGVADPLSVSSLTTPVSVPPTAAAGLQTSHPITTANVTNDITSTSSSSIPTNTADDPMFWGNFDMNISDIFSAASWENMTGSGGPMNLNLSLGGTDFGFGFGNTAFGGGGGGGFAGGESLGFNGGSTSAGGGNSGDGFGGWNDFAFTAGGNGTTANNTNHGGGGTGLGHVGDGTHSRNRSGTIPGGGGGGGGGGDGGHSSARRRKRTG